MLNSLAGPVNRCVSVIYGQRRPLRRWVRRTNHQYGGDGFHTKQGFGGRTLRGYPERWLNAR